MTTEALRRMAQIEALRVAGGLPDTFAAGWEARTSELVVALDTEMVKATWRGYRAVQAGRYTEEEREAIIERMAKALTVYLWGRETTNLTPELMTGAARAAYEAEHGAKS